MKILIDFNGGPLDGSASLEREVAAGESMTFTEMVVMMAAGSTSYHFDVGQRFAIPSPGWLTRTVVRQDRQCGLLTTFTYEITDRLEGDGELMVVAKYIGQNPSVSELPA